MHLLCALSLQDVGSSQICVRLIHFIFLFLFPKPWSNIHLQSRLCVFASFALEFNLACELQFFHIFFAHNVHLKFKLYFWSYVSVPILVSIRSLLLTCLVHVTLSVIVYNHISIASSLIFIFEENILRSLILHIVLEFYNSLT